MFIILGLLILLIIIWIILYLNAKRNFEASQMYRFDNVDHIWDEFNTKKAGPGTWSNLHGFKTTDGHYYCCVDARFLGIRMQDIIVRCNTREFYEEMQSEARSGGLKRTISDDNRINDLSSGKKEFEFNCVSPTYQKTFRIRLALDGYGEQK